MRPFCIAAVCLALGCGYPSFGFATSDAATEDAPTEDTDPSADTTPDADVSMEDAPADATPETKPCELPIAGSACVSIPKITTSKIDGAPDELCGVGATVLNAAGAAATEPSPPPFPPPENAYIRTAWTDLGLHVHVKVDDPILSVVPASSTDLWNGDSVEIFVAAGLPATGSYAMDHAIQIDVAPQFSGIPARARAFYSASSAEVPAGVQWASRGAPTGYEVEVFIAWSVIGLTSAPKQIGYDVALNVDDHPETPGEDVWMAMEDRKVTGATPCGVTAKPACDTRTFCTPTLSP